MIVLGIDPGIRHIGWAVLRDGKVSACDTILPPGEGRISVETVLTFVLPKLQMVLEEHQPIIASVEQVSWYGRGKRITLPLSHIAGAIVGLLWHAGIDCFCLSPNMKNLKVRRKASWDDHQYDAAVLAKVAETYELARIADNHSYLKQHSAAGRRRLTARHIV